MTMKVGLDSTKVRLTDAGKAFFRENYPPSIVWEHDVDGEFTLRSMVVVGENPVVELLCPMGVPYRLPSYVDGEITFNMADKEAEG